MKSALTDLTLDAIAGWNAVQAHQRRVANVVQDGVQDEWLGFPDASTLPWPSGNVRRKVRVRINRRRGGLCRRPRAL
jgi:hypothetical protein